jgi:hypothetical protein
MDLAKLLGRRAPYSTGDMFYVYLTRDLPFMTALALAPLAFSSIQWLSFGDYLALTGGLPYLVLSAVVIGPVLETGIFIVFILMMPPAWYQAGSNALSADGRRIALSIICGALFGALHLSTSLVAAIGAMVGGTVMFAVLLQHWLANLRDRGIVMCWALHVVHNALMLPLLAVFHP